MKKIVSLILAALLALTAFSAVLAEDAPAAEAAEAADPCAALVEMVADEDYKAILTGVGQGWAPTIMVLLNDGTFYCLVDYAGQATVNFVQGEYVENADGSVTATGALYTDGSEIVYEIANNNGALTCDVAIPDTDAVATLTCGAAAAPAAEIPAECAALVEMVADEDYKAILAGVAQGWAPTIMVLLNDGSFYCLVDYAGQATVNFVQGEYAENADGSITATGALYTDGSEIVYEIANNGGVVTCSVAIPDTEAVADLAGVIG